MSTSTPAALRHRPDKRSHELLAGEWRSLGACRLPCGHLVSIVSHGVSPAGLVTPSVVCPAVVLVAGSAVRTCGDWSGHYELTLGGWSERYR